MPTLRAPSRSLPLLSLLGLAALGSGCGAILGLDDFTESGSTAAGGGSSASTSTTTAGGTGGSEGTTTTTGASTTSGGTGGAMFCMPGTSLPCYSGAPGTDGTGACKKGVKTCLPDGTAYDDKCMGEITPTADDDCVAMVDTNCDGKTSCACTPNQALPCYDGAAGTEGHGTCKGGTHTCDAQGSSFGACVGQILPAAIDDCATPDDENCDGVTNDACTCTPNSTASCYGGPAGTAGVGLCKAGTQVCNAGGTAYGACMGEVHPTTDVCSNAVDEDCNGTYCTQTIWAKQFGDPADQNANSITSDPDGNVLVGGDFQGTLNFGMNALLNVGNLDAFVAKLDPNGNYLWAKEIGDGSFQKITSVVTDAAKNVYIAGEFVGSIDMSPVGTLTASGCDLFIAKLDPTGKVLWAKQYGGTSTCEPGPIFLAVHGTSVYAAGEFQGSIAMGNTITATSAATDGFVGKLDATNGNGQWVKQIGESPGANQTQGVDAIAVDSSGSAYVTGFMQGTVNFGATSVSGPTMFVAKYDSAGNNVNAKSWGATGSTGFSSIAVDGLGGIFITGLYLQTVTIGNKTLTLMGGSTQSLLALKYNPNFTVAWAQGYGTGGNQITPSMALTPDGGLIITGRFSGKNDFGGGVMLGSGDASKYDLFLLKVDGLGQHVWSRSYGTAGTDQGGDAIAVDPSGNVLVAGHNQGMVDFGLGVLTSAGNHDILVAKIAGQ